MKDNKLIAEFMGGYTPYERFGDSTEYYYKGEHINLNDMQFNSSWDWLMPVIENIDHLQYAPVKGIEDALSTRHIGDTHKAVVEFIKTYNDEQ